MSAPGTGSAVAGLASASGASEFFGASNAELLIRLYPNLAQAIGDAASARVSGSAEFSGLGVAKAHLERSHVEIIGLGRTNRHAHALHFLDGLGRQPIFDNHRVVLRQRQHAWRVRGGVGVKLEV